MWYKNIAGRFFGLVTKHACDGQTDGQTDRRTDRITTPKTGLSIACAAKTFSAVTECHATDVQLHFKSEPRPMFILWLTSKWWDTASFTRVFQTNETKETVDDGVTLNSRAELESYKVANVVENCFAFLDCRPTYSPHTHAFVVQWGFCCKLTPGPDGSSNRKRSGVTVEGFYVPSFPPVDNIWAMTIVWRIRGRLSKLFCAVLCTTVVHNDTHTYQQFSKLTTDLGFFRFRFFRVFLPFCFCAIWFRCVSFSFFTN